MKEFYTTIFKRKSVRKYDETLKISEEELANIMQKTTIIIPLDSDIKVKFDIVKIDETTVKRGEYCLLLYSEKKGDYLLNAGYILEQMDLYLTSNNYGVCWFGTPKPKVRKLEGLDYVIMLGFGKSGEGDFRSSIDEFERLDKEIIWQGEFDEEVKNAVRLTPSACNSQPWRIVSNDGKIEVYRTKKVNTVIPAALIKIMNTIDMGICLCFIEIALLSKGYRFARIIENGKMKSKMMKIATYLIE